MDTIIQFHVGFPMSQHPCPMAQFTNHPQSIDAGNKVASTYLTILYSIPIFVWLAVSSNMTAQGTLAPYCEEGTVEDCYIVGPSAVRVPPGYFLLIRKGMDVGAIRFMEFRKGHDNLIGSAKYESYFLTQGKGSFSDSAAILKSGSVTTKMLSGFGRLSFGGGRRKLRIGNWTFTYRFPTWVSMYPDGEVEQDFGYEFAPTSAEEVSQIDVTNNRLRWYRNSQTTSIRITIKELRTMAGERTPE